MILLMVFAGPGDDDFWLNHGWGLGHRCFFPIASFKRGEDCLSRVALMTE